MTIGSELDEPDAWGNAFVGLYVWDNLGGTLFRVARVDTKSHWVWFEFVNPFTVELTGSQGDMDGLELMELVREGDYEILSQREVRERAASVGCDKLES